MIPQGVRVPAGSLPAASAPLRPVQSVLNESEQIAILGSMKCGKTTLAAGTFREFYGPGGAGASGDGVGWVLRPWADNRCQAPEGQKYVVYSDLQDEFPKLLVGGEQDLQELLQFILTPSHKLPPHIPAPGANDVILADESHLLHEDTWALLLRAMAMNGGPTPKIIAVSIYKGLTAEPLPWAVKLTGVVASVHLAAGCERCDAVSLDVVSIHHLQARGARSIPLAALVGGHEDYINMCPECRWEGLCSVEIV